MVECCVSAYVCVYCVFCMLGIESCTVTQVHMHTHVYIAQLCIVCTHLLRMWLVVQCSPSLSVPRAARAKLQRLEKQNHQLEKTVATLRHAQAKAEELEKANKRLNGAAHDSRREIIKLKGVGTVWA